MLVSDNILDKNVGSQFSGPFMFFSTVKYEKDNCKCCEQRKIKWSLYTRMCTLTLLLSDKMFEQTVNVRASQKQPERISDGEFSVSKGPSL